MRTYRHKNGKGLKEASAEVCPLSIFDRGSQATGKTSVWSSYVENSHIHDSLVTSAIIKRSSVTKTTITGGYIEDSQIHAELISDSPIIRDSLLLGATRVGHTANIVNATLKNWTVFGDAFIEGWEADGQEGYISRGYWSQPPRILRLDGLTITESVNGFAFCGCYEYPIDQWLKGADRYGKVAGLGSEDIGRIKAFLYELK